MTHRAPVHSMQRGGLAGVSEVQDVSPEHLELIRKAIASALETPVQGEHGRGRSGGSTRCCIFLASQRRGTFGSFTVREGRKVPLASGVESFAASFVGWKASHG